MGQLDHLCVAAEKSLLPILECPLDALEISGAFFRFFGDIGVFYGSFQASSDAVRFCYGKYVKLRWKDIPQYSPAPDIVLSVRITWS